MYILQESLFSFDELQKLESKDRLPIFFSALDLRSYAKELRNPSPRGADGHCRQGILRALLAAPLENIDTFTGLHRRLELDLRFRYQCGLRLDRKAPSIATLSRVFTELTTKDLAKRLFEDLVLRCKEEGIINGRHVAIDSAAIHAYEKKQPKRKSELTGNANWGAKFDSFGNKVKWFGYKLHLAVDTASELPMALLMTPAHVNDGELAPALIQQVAASTKVKFFVLDAGYDQLKNYEAARNVKAQAIIPMNLRNEKEPPSGMTSSGRPCCSMGLAMTYWGVDGHHLKFRCPHAKGKVDCPFGMAACSSSNYGLVVKVDTKSDLRRYSSPHRDTKRWKELYNERTSVERCNSRMKTYLTADVMHVWGIQKVTTHQYLNAIVLVSTFSLQTLPRLEISNFSFLSSLSL
ncbi:transposase [Paenibacillus peoriae]|uniref:Transposase n=1 Tax=Paenibacillus peoriae TaxID=59893 RepID=A0A7H0Y1Z7_9BACL|nr:transposase [Paenibacillus peoriae]QNR65105.1 transposase [Paenibacillus peoriae]